MREHLDVPPRGCLGDVIVVVVGQEQRRDVHAEPLRRLLERGAGAAGVDDEGDEPCRVWGEQATLVLWGPDYDGGHKAWVRWPDGSDDIVPGSQVERG